MDSIKGHTLDIITKSFNGLTKQDVTATTTTTINLSLGPIINLAHGTDIDSLSFTNLPVAGEWIISRDGGSSDVIVWGDSIVWDNATTPAFAANTFKIWRFSKTPASTKIQAVEIYSRLGPELLMTAVTGSSPFSFNYNILTPEKLADLPTLPTGPSTGVAWSYDGKWLAVAHDASPRISVYDSTNAYAKESNPATLPNGDGLCVAFSPNGLYMAVGHQGGGGFLKVYNVGTWTSITVPAMANEVYGVQFSADSNYLAVAHFGSPYFAVIKTSTWTKLSNPASLPPNTCNDVSFRHNSAEVAVACDSSPYIIRYSLIADVLTKLSDPSVLPPGLGFGIEYSNDDSFLAIQHSGGVRMSIYDPSDMSKISTPAVTLPNYGGKISFSADDSKMGVGHGTTPFISVFTTADWSKDANLPSLPANTARSIAFIQGV